MEELYVEEIDIYDEDGAEQMFEDDSLSAGEYGFMVGYNAA
jgi:hypothetical protein